MGNRDGDSEAASQALVEAASTADSFEKAVVETLRGNITPAQMQAQAKDDNERCGASYYLGVKALLENRNEEAISYFEKSASSNQHQLPEYDLARWHLRDLKAQP